MTGNVAELTDGEWLFFIIAGSTIAAIIVSNPGWV